MKPHLRSSLVPQMRFSISKKNGPSVNVCFCVTIQFRPSCNQTKNPEVIPGIFCIGMAEVV